MARDKTIVTTIDRLGIRPRDKTIATTIDRLGLRLGRRLTQVEICRARTMGRDRARTGTTATAT